MNKKILKNKDKNKKESSIIKKCNMEDKPKK
jgi:hypothetical protein